MIQSSTMRPLRALSPLLLWLALPAMASKHNLPPVQPATEFPAVEVHTDEKVAIAADPYDTREKEAIFGVDYLSHNVLPIRLIVTNNGDQPISLLEARIFFVTAGGAELETAEPQDVERLMKQTDGEGGSFPLPMQLPRIKLKLRAGDSEIEQDFDTFEYRRLKVEPHSTRAGFVFYDLSGLIHPLEGAKLYLRGVRDSNGAELLYFEIPFDKYLQSKPSQMN